MEDPHYRQAYSGILGISRLLPQVRQGFLEDCETHDRTIEEGERV